MKENILEAVELKYVLDNPNTDTNKITPRKATRGSAGYDLVACIGAPIEIPPQSIVGVPTGVSLRIMDPHFVGLVYPRSGMSLKGINLANCVGVIDSDYTGEIKVLLKNNTNEYYTVNPYDRIAQIVFTQAYSPTFYVYDNRRDQNTQTVAGNVWGGLKDLPGIRNSGGFGSTGC